MFIQPRNMSGKLKGEFNQPVETIMRCEDFKSNFARKLSNRYSSRSSVSQSKQETELTLRPPDSGDAANVSDNVSEINNQITQLPRKSIMGQNGEAVKPPDKPSAFNSDIRRIQVTVLNMEVETLRWQLEQTEANRQMHIALLNQIVAFLNRVKEHIDRQNNEVSSRDILPKRLLIPKSFNVADLPRSRSVVQVNKNFEYPLTTPKKMCTRKISKSISSVNGFKEYNSIWNQSKLSPDPGKETSQKITEEMSRLINLANTVLSTKIPDLACSCNDTESNLIKPLHNNADHKCSINPNAAVALSHIEENAAANFKESFEIPEDIKVETDSNKNSSSSLLCVLGLDNTFPEMKSNKQEQSSISLDDPSVALVNTSTKTSEEKRNEFNSSFIEDESGFSSMSSFQEIGIPIISIIPPSPSKEIGFLEEIPDLDDDVEKWKTDTMDLEKQTMKVFWV